MKVLPSFIISDLKTRVRLSDIIDRELGLHKLKKVTGSSDAFTACCPFHDDKSPSLSIQDDIGVYHCFGCGEKGDVFDLYRDHLGKTFRQTLGELASMCGLDLESLYKDVDLISKAPKPVDSKYALQFTNSIFNTYAKYDPFFSPPSKTSGKSIEVPSSLNDMKYTLTAVNHLFDSNNGGRIAELLTENQHLKEAANQLGVIDDETGQLKYPHELCFLPAITITDDLDSGSNLPHIVNNRSQPKQFQCAGFVVLNHELEHVGYYPDTAVKSSSALLIPPPSVFDTVDRMEKIYITDSPEQYIDLVSCGMNNVVAPAYGQLNHQHLRYISQLPVRDVCWVTTADSLAHEQIVSRLAIFSECLGTNKSLSLTILKNNEDNTPFASMVVDSGVSALAAIDARSINFEKVLRIASPTVSRLEGNAKSFAIRAIAQCTKKSLLSKSGNSDELVQACAKMLDEKHITPTALISLITNEGKALIEKLLDFTNYPTPTVEQLITQLSGENSDEILTISELKNRLTNTEQNLVTGLEVTNDNLKVAIEFITKLHEIQPELVLEKSLTATP